jgi:pyruvate carboxylase subunit B
MNFQCTIGENVYELNIDARESAFEVNGEQKNFEFIYENNRHLLRVGTKLYKLDNVSYEGTVITFTLNGDWCSVDVKDEQQLLLDKLGFKSGDAAGEGILKSPMPGKILDIMVSEGDTVEKGQRIAILEAMKMENELKAPVGGSISALHVAVGDSVEKNTPILEIESIG